MNCIIYSDIHAVWHLGRPTEAIGSQGLRGAKMERTRTWSDQESVRTE
jgi:hypothetical protein